MTSKKPEKVLSQTNAGIKLESVWHLTAQRLGLTNYNINFISEKCINHLLYYKASIANNDTEEKFDILVKMQPHSENETIRNMRTYNYETEINFYLRLFPAFQNLEKKHKIQNFFNFAPQLITTANSLNQQMIVLNDYTSDGYQMKNQNVPLDDEHICFTLKLLGHFHALSFSLKNQEYEQFLKYTEKITFWGNSIPEPVLDHIINSVIYKCFQILDQTNDGPIKKKLETYLSNGAKIFKKSACYRGKYSALVHGDCVSNKLRFKYKDYHNRKDVEHMMLLDFQNTFLGTPVYDLASFLYLAGSNNLIQNLKSYLNLYYKSFAEVVSNLGNNPADLLPLEELYIDWKKYAKYGMIVAFSVALFQQKIDDDTTFIDVETLDEIDDSFFTERAANIIRYMFEIDAL